ncbi:hypothetical protein OIU76_002835 [Salix suchowensis]|nr:hypothetical protein OIU76_002835 [Salix suchowensis]
MTMRCRKTGDKIILDGENLLPESKRNQRRWRVAYTAIHFTRLLGSLSRKALESQTKLLRSLSNVAIDVRDDTPRENHVSLMNVDQRALADMVKGKNLEYLRQLGGVAQVATAILETDVKNGANEAGVAHRRDVFGANKFKKPPVKSFLSFVVEAFKDMTIIILLVCAIMSLGFGIEKHGLKEGWYDGGSIIVAIVLVVAVSAVRNSKQSKQSDERNNINVQVVRDGQHRDISIFDVVVGDVVSLKIEDQIPADGMFLNGYSLKVDESSMSGQSDHVEVNGNDHPFLLSGTKVTDGFGFMLVTSVGMNTAWGERMSSICHDLDDQTPLQARLNKLSSSIGKLGLTVDFLVLAVLMIRYFTGNTTDDNGQQRKRWEAHKDKTGTLTLNKMKVTEFWLGKETIDDNSVSEIESEVYQLLQEGVALNTTSTINKSHATSVPEITGSPTEKAILSWAQMDFGHEYQ